MVLKGVSYDSLPIVKLILESGAEVNCKANIYGGSTVLQLLLSSAHPSSAGTTQDIARILRTAGAV